MRWYVLALCGGLGLSAAPTPKEATFHKHVEPLLQARCQNCHRPGEAAPMSLLTYADARPWAKAIKEAVLVRKMPPWFADPAHGEFANERRLSQDEIDIIQRLLSSERHRLDNMNREHPYRVEITALMEAFSGYNVKVDIEGLIEI